MFSPALVAASRTGVSEEQWIVVALLVNSTSKPVAFSPPPLTRIKMHGLLQQLVAKHRPAVLLVTHDVDEAILLANRVIVLTDGEISLSSEVGIPQPRSRETPEFGTLRRRLLTELGVGDEPDAR
ncbi:MULTISPECIES: hypothetical protein [Rhodococcus]|uniref:hypothetical protein n=1 Tax=Rhodococcus TaxID=1827 RepID=UPI000AA972C0|nr:hypothetical protein [Rhodococcus koreensis]